MKPKLTNRNVVARCPDCRGAITTFEYRDSSGEFGLIQVRKRVSLKELLFDRITYRLLRCASCGRGGMAELYDNFDEKYYLGEFFPFSIEKAKIPDNIPLGIVSEFREAELCASFGGLRASSALFRSTLEKVLKQNGYIKGTLASRIDEAADDGIITELRRKRAHEDVRVLGNDVLHDEWRDITPEEVEASHHYVQRILEDFYDDRASVEAILKEHNRIQLDNE